MIRIASIFAVLFIIAIAFWSSVGFQDGFGTAVAMVNEYIVAHEFLGATVFIIFAALSAVLSPFSSIPTIPLAVAVWGQELTLLFLVCGWFIGSVASYLIGHHGLHDVYKKVFPVKKIEKYRNQLSEHSEFMLVVLFRLAVPSEIVGLVLGSVRYDFPKYLVATLITEIPFAVISVYASEAFVLKDPVQLVIWFSVGFSILVIASVVLAKKIGK